MNWAIIVTAPTNYVAKHIPKRYETILSLVIVPCHIIQNKKDLVVLVVVAEYLHQRFGGSSIVEVMSLEAHELAVYRDTDT
ncbi:hypothetical protein AHAS_Ahas16G0073900 [Arachis hypogaea]